MFEPFVQDARSGLSRLLFFTFGRGWQPGARASNGEGRLAVEPTSQSAARRRLLNHDRYVVETSKSLCPAV